MVIAVIIAGASLGALGLFFALGLGIASKVFAVEVDPKVQAIDEALPGANCGACGYPGCSGFAKAVVAGEAEVNGCIAGGHEVADAIAKIMGVEAGKVEAQIAKVMCYYAGCAPPKFEYVGVDTCRAASLLHGGSKLCSYACLGLGSCQTICPFEAISHEDGRIKVDREKCTGCGKCVNICPREVITLVPKKSKVHILCNSHDKGKAVKEICEFGCIGCAACKKVCEAEAIIVDNFLAKIDYQKCTECKTCVGKCPTGSIVVSS